MSWCTETAATHPVPWPGWPTAWPPPTRPQFGPPLRQQLAARQVPADLIEQLCTRMASLNQAIADDPELGPDFVIGHSYFCQPPAQPGQASEWLRLIFEQEIGPLLADYWREQPATAAAQLRKLLA